MKSLRLAAFLMMAGSAWAADAGRELLVCGWDEVFILRPGAPSPTEKVWRWKALERPELPAHLKTRFKTTADCKAVAGNRILIVASDGGIALVERAGGKAVFWALCGNTHSAELLPGGRLVAACSTHADGNRLAVFDIGTPERQVFSTELYSGHGALWDEGRKRLWAVGGAELRAYSLAGWDSREPSLKLEARYPLPSPGGHDLVEIDRHRLGVTAVRAAWIFDRERAEFLPHPELGSQRDVKSISVHPDTRQLAYTLADVPEWWTRTIRFLNPAATLKLEEERIYKVRWVK
jgi:hypothetical protein